MGQPVRKIIKETHADLISEEPEYTLLIDGNSLLFFCMVDEKTNEDNIHYGGIYQFLLQLNIQLNKKDFDYIYVTFDNEFSGYKRWELYPYYKQNRDKHYEEYGECEYAKALNEKLKRMQKYLYSKNKKMSTVKQKSAWEEFIDKNFDRERNVLMQLFEELYIRCYMDEIVEGDDLISYYCKNKKKNEKIVIVSGDMDLMQLISDDICVYNLKHKKYIYPGNFSQIFGYYYENTLIKKIFCGDVSDNIGNIKGLSELGFENLMPEYKTKKVTIEDVKKKAQMLIEERKKEKKKPLQVHENIVNGVSNKKYDGDFYKINEKIINLKEPIMTNTAKEYMDSIMYAPIDPEGRSFSNVYKIITENKISELRSDAQFSSFFRLFKRIEEKEKKRYEKTLSV